MPIRNSILTTYASSALLNTGRFANVSVGMVASREHCQTVLVARTASPIETEGIKFLNIDLVCVGSTKDPNRKSPSKSPPENIPNIMTPCIAVHPVAQ